MEPHPFAEFMEDDEPGEQLQVHQGSADLRLLLASMDERLEGLAALIGRFEGRLEELHAAELERHRAAEREIGSFDAVSGRLSESATAAGERLDGAITNILEQITRSQAKTEEQVARITKLAHASAWRSLAVAGGALVLALIASGWAVWANVCHLSALRAETKRLELLSSVTIGNCGGEPCVQLSEASHRWGKDKDYVILTGRRAAVAPAAPSKQAKP